MLDLEEKRSERSRIPFVLALLTLKEVRSMDGQASVFIRNVMNGLASCMRETDVMGWYRNEEILGAIFTHVGQESNAQLALKHIEAKVKAALERTLTSEECKQVQISWYLFPDNSVRSNTSRPPDTISYQEDKTPPRWLQSAGKRAIDILGSVFALVFLSPLFIIVALAVKASSPGPVLFRQERVGRFGRPFVFLKFRTMKTQNCSTIHEQYMKSFISGASSVAQNGLYKIQNDPRITALGNLLRKTSLDELPQFWNVLRGDMSLVGPRPPIPYEIEMYDVWHRRRYLVAKPGITGLWQVTGRSRTTFDDMVRLDLRYVHSSSIWLDLKILWRTPIAIVTGTGAY